MPRAATRGSRALVAMTAAAVTTTASRMMAGVTVRFGRPGSGAGGLQVGVGGRLEDPERRDRPVAEERPPDHVRDRDRAEDPRVGRGLAVIAHDEQLALGDDP